MRMQFVLELLPDEGMALAPHGTASSQPRYLNCLGRWAAYGTELTPLLGWEDEASAQAACDTASLLRHSRIVASSLSGAHPRISAHVQRFHRHQTPALATPLPAQNTAFSRKAIDCVKTTVFSHAILAIENAPQDAKCRIESRWNRHIHTLFGGGSIVSASQFLTGKRAASAVQMICTGQYTPECPSSEDLIRKAMAMARKHPWNLPTP